MAGISKRAIFFPAKMQIISISMVGLLLSLYPSAVDFHLKCSNSGLFLLFGYGLVGQHHQIGDWVLDFVCVCILVR